MKAARILLPLGIAIMLVPILLIGGCYLRSKDYERGYAKISEGNTKQKVIDSMGQPEDVETCNAPIYSDQGFRGQCAHTLVYYSFLEKWGVVLDKNDVVIAKYYNVSP